MNSRERSRALLYYGSIALVALGLTAMFVVSPYVWDDYDYMRFLGVTSDGVPATIDWDNFYHQWVSHFYTDNWRLANLTAAIMYAFPKWLVHVASGGMIFWTIMTMGRMIGLTSRNWQWMAIFAMLYTVVPVWFEAMVGIDYQTNYVWSTALSLLCFSLFMRSDRVNWFVMLAVGGITGAWHEGFAIPLCCAFVALAVLHRQYRTCTRFIMIGGMIVGIMLLLIAPGTGNRIAGIGIHNFIDNLPSLTFANISWMAYVVLCLVALWRKDRMLWKDPLAQLLMVVGAAAATISYYTVAIRAAWPGQIVGCMGVVYLLHKYFEPHGQRWLTAGAVAALAFVVGHLTEANVMAARLGKEEKTVVAAFVQNQNQTLFTPITEQHEASPLVLGKPYYGVYNNFRGYADFKYYGDLDPKNFKIVDSRLKSFEWGAGELLPSGVCQYNDKFVTRKPEVEHDDAVFCCWGYIYNSLMRQPTVFHCTPFAGADGQSYIYVYYLYAEPHTLLLPITNIVIDWDRPW